MTIQVRCPNSDCGKVLSVRDDFAGQTGRCPSCGATLDIPAGGEGPAHVVPVRSRRPDPEEEDPVPVYPSRPRRRPRDDYDDEYEDSDYEEDRRGARRRSPYDERYGRRRPPSTAGTIVCLGIGIGLLVFLAFVPLFPMFSFTFPANFRVPVQPEVGGMIKLTEGMVLVIVTGVVALICVVALILYLSIAESISDIFLTVAGCLAGGWSITVLVWMVAFIWDIFTFNGVTKTRGGVGIVPGIGLWLGLGLALGLVAVFATLIGIRGRTLWLYLGEGVGLVAGILLLTLNVQPWESNDKMKYLAAKEKRYRPLLLNEANLRRAR
jgi:hypothetical protein